METVLVSARSAEWAAAPQVNSFDVPHYKTIHRFLFSDLYNWAGQVRTVNISKKGTVFCAAEQIEAQAAMIFGRLKKMDFFSGLSHSDFVEEIADFYCATNQLHPFREGNGRTQRVFLAQLIQNAGYALNWSEVDGDLLMIATIQASQGVQELLKQVFYEHIR